jgi:uncharacterized protein YcfL
MKKLLLLFILLILLVGCEQEGTHYRCSEGTPGIFPTPSGCIESENGAFETMEDCEIACEY